MKFAVIDLETTYSNTIMTAGVVISDDDNFDVKLMKYYLVRPTEFGWYSDRIRHPRLWDYPDMTVVKMGDKAEKFEGELIKLLRGESVEYIFAYCAGFDRSKLPMLAHFRWVDIVSKAANRNTNPFLPEKLDYFKTGRLKSNYGVEPIYRYLTGNKAYKESHNAIVDCIDELEIIKRLGYSVGDWPLLKVK